MRRFSTLDAKALELSENSLCERKCEMPTFMIVEYYKGRFSRKYCCHLSKAFLSEESSYAFLHNASKWKSSSYYPRHLTMRQVHSSEIRIDSIFIFVRPCIGARPKFLFNGPACDPPILFF